MRLVIYLVSEMYFWKERKKIPWKYYDLYGRRHRLTPVDTKEKVDFVKISGKGVISSLKTLTVLSRVEW